MSLSPDAYECAKMLCEQYYLGAPELELRETNGERRRSSLTTVCFLFFFPLTRSANRRCSSSPPLVPAANNAREPIYISYIPSHLYHMLFELFKVINQDESLMRTGARFRKDVEVWWLNFKSSGRFKVKRNN